MPLLQVPADQAAVTMYDKLHGKTDGLPKKLQGVFWMSDNMLPDLMMLFDGASFDPDKRVLTIHYGAPYTWSWSGFAPFPTLFLGWWMALTSFGSYLTSSNIRVHFNEDYTDGRLYLYIFKYFWLPTGMIWTMTDISHRKDGSVWDRGIYFWLLPSLKFAPGSYTLRQIIDSNGHRLHVFKDMMNSLWSPEHSGTPVKGVTIKALEQLIWGDRLVERGGEEGSWVCSDWAIIVCFVCVLLVLICILLKRRRSRSSCDLKEASVTPALPGPLKQRSSPSGCPLKGVSATSAVPIDEEAGAIAPLLA
jgi:hypothetical protein